MKLLIDGDVIAYRAGFATEKTKYLVTDAVAHANKTLQAFESAQAAKQYADSIVGNAGVIWSRKEVEPEDKALLITDVMIGDIRARYQADNPNVVVFLSGVGNFRNAIATRATYKGNREGSTKPKHFRAIRDHLVAKWGALLSSQEEADDLIGIAATMAPDSIVCSIDKDLMQLPGRHYNFVTKEETAVSPKDAVLNFYVQALSGDPVDNVPGVDGIGPVRARKILDGAKSPYECWQRTVDAYQTAYGAGGYVMAIEAARLVFVRRQVNQDWSPPVSEATSAAPQRKTKASRR
jgi:hypothetical protein